MTFLIPDTPPPVLLSLDFASPPPNVEVPPGGSIANGGLLFPVDAQDTAAGLPLGGVSFRDAIFETQLRLVEGDANDLYGVFVRRAETGRYVCFALSTDGRVVIRHFDGQQFQAVMDGGLAPDMRFLPGLDAANLFHVVACGPQLTFILNGMVVFGVTVERGLAQGELGTFVHHGLSSAVAVVRTDWCQVRAVLPPLRPVHDMDDGVQLEVSRTDLG